METILKYRKYRKVYVILTWRIILSTPTVYDIATKHDIIEGAPNRTLESAILIMGNKNFRRLPITKLGKIRGILTVTDIIRAIAKVGLPDAFDEEISDWMTRIPKTVDPATSVYDATKMMSAGNFGSLLIVDHGSDILKAIITERDILRHVKDEKFEVNMKTMDKDLLTNDLIKIDKSLILEEALKIMNDARTHRILTFDGEELVGILTANSITALCSNQREEISQNRNFLKSIDANYVASNDVITMDIDNSISNAIDLMVAENIGSLPLLEDGKVVGIFSERTLIHYLAQD